MESDEIYQLTLICAMQNRPCVIFLMHRMQSRGLREYTQPTETERKPQNGKYDYKATHFNVYTYARAKKN